MANPTITTAGASSGLFKITSQDGIVSRIPKTTVSDLVDSSNDNAQRLEIFSANNSIVLIFETEADKNTFITSFDAAY